MAYEHLKHDAPHTPSHAPSKLKQHLHALEMQQAGMLQEEEAIITVPDVAKTLMGSETQKEDQLEQERVDKRREASCGWASH